MTSRLTMTVLAIAQLATPSPVFSLQARAMVLAPDLRIDGNAEDLSRIIGLAVDPEGRILVSQPDDQSYLVYDNRGQRLGEMGRKGEGPGEFTTIGIFRGWVGSWFWQFDPALQRVTAFDPVTRKVASTRPVRVTDPGGVRGQPSGVQLILPSVVGVASDGGLLVWSPVVPGNASRSGWATDVPPDAGSLLLATNADGGIRSVVATWPPLFGGCMQMVNGRNRPVPQCQSWLWAVSPNGRHAAFVDVDRAGPYGRVRVLSLDVNGDTSFAVTTSVPLVPIGRADEDSIRRHRIELTQNDELRQDWKAIQLPRNFPSALAVTAADDGSVWVKLRRGRGAFVWKEFVRGGRMGDEVELPEGVKLDVVTTKALYGIESDRDGVQSVVRFPRRP